MSESPVSLSGDVLQNLNNIAEREWLATNGIGGYASGTVSGMLTRKYHGLLVASLNPPGERTLLCTKLDETLIYKGKSYPLFTNQWADNSINPLGYQYLVQFQLEGSTPVWTFAVEDCVLQKRVWMKEGENTTCVAYYLAQASEDVTLQLDCFVNYRDHHHVTKATWEMSVEPCENGCEIKAKENATPFYLFCEDAEFKNENTWYYNFKLTAEEERGYEALDHSLKAGSFIKKLSPGQLISFVATINPETSLNGIEAYEEKIDSQIKTLDGSWASEGNHPAWVKQLVLSANQFIVSKSTENRPNGKTIIAGYHWFSEWTRDTMISLPGLTFDKPELAKEILLTYSQFIEQGVLPTNFPEHADEKLQYNNVDSTLWYFQALKSYFDQTNDYELLRELFIKLGEIIDWHFKGTFHGIKVDPEDYLLVANDPGWQLTWMDAKYGDKVFTPRAGKPVEVNALWYNALMCMANWSDLLEIQANKEYYSEAAKKVRTSFQKFWNADLKCLYDVIDTPSGWEDSSVRPNQILAVSLPYGPLTQIQEEGVVKTCESQLYTPYGLRTLSPKDSQYIGNYSRGTLELRDEAYHQGTAWLWLLGSFVVAHYKTFKDRTKALSFFDGISKMLLEYGMGTLGEIFDGNAPFKPEGCIAQAWSVAEVLRAYKFISEQKED